MRRGSPTLGRFDSGAAPFAPFTGKSPAGAGLSCFYVKQRRRYFCPNFCPNQAILEKLGIKRSPTRASRAATSRCSS
jgi:hypothetical protein